MANKSNTPVITAEMVEAFLANKKAMEATAKAEAKAAREAAKNAPKVKRSPEDFRAEKAKRNAETQTAFGGLVFQTCSITGGKKDNMQVGNEVDCVWVGVTRKFMQPVASVILKDGSKDWINPKFLKAVKPMADVAVATHKAEREDEASQTLYIAARVVRENVGKSVLLDYQGWFAPKWFPVALTTKTGAEQNGLPILEIPAWNIRQAVGQIGVADLEGKQAELAKLVNEASA